jgi:hypothetical protein
MAMFYIFVETNFHLSGKKFSHFGDLQGKREAFSGLTRYKTIAFHPVLCIKDDGC